MGPPGRQLGGPRGPSLSVRGLLDPWLLAPWLLVRSLGLPGCELGAPGLPGRQLGTPGPPGCWL